jgi:predicted lipoprotein with Yx(FWY)xxD motif
MRRPARRAGVAALVLFSTTACGPGAAGAGDTALRATQPAPTLSAATLETSHTDLGTILVDGSGRTLYSFTGDRPGAQADCARACLRRWPPLDAPDAHAGMGVTETLIATVEGPDGTEQISYHERPLYYFAGDGAVGDTSGQGVTAFGGTWRAVRPDGTPVSVAGGAPRRGSPAPRP